MIIWDWLLARLLGRPVFGAEYDGQGVKNPAVGLGGWMTADSGEDQCCE